MKKLISSAVALALVAGSAAPVLAQQNDRREERQDNRQQARKQDNRQQARQQDRQQQARQQQARQQDRQQQARQQQARQQDRQQQARQQDRRQDNRQQARQQDRRQDLRQDARQARRWDNANDRRWYQSRWNNRARTFDSRVYRRAFNSPRRYRAGVYYRPSGYYYRRWGVGSIFPRLFWSSNYFINSWGSYGLLAPPWGYEWVRYGPDAVLVDVRTGAILQVRYNVFY